MESQCIGAEPSKTQEKLQEHHGPVIVRLPGPPAPKRPDIGGEYFPEVAVILDIRVGENLRLIIINKLIV